ncbi:hypothetical protein HYH03_010428 [Edaphochlamys debaryana]|uniref:Right handed beta helix domain-containing protein n=1 Tax=Edaphochlamys debaryana TaxID=47281 RepID=A0A836BXH0_9CHLO|nr:hypothetical protein HYH03_010428 [Edaphochlamys debaryana]|eukprot:KAG2491218.1 hypothetical protein HYH03_010428 [Edaphochlamys debaryana]
MALPMGCTRAACPGPQANTPLGVQEPRSRKPTPLYPTAVVGGSVASAAAALTKGAGAEAAPGTAPGLVMGRRAALLGGMAAGLGLAWQDTAARAAEGPAAADAPAEGTFAYVSSGGSGEGAAPEGARRFGSVAEAVEACPEGGVVLVGPGRYRERLVLTRPISIRAWPKYAPVELVWETPQPYQSTLQLEAQGEVLLEGLTVRHSSKSVANNYAVYITAGTPRLVDCDVSSASGAGVGVEGASPQLLGCRIHDCARQGMAIFGPAALDDPLDRSTDPGFLYGSTGGVVQGCDIYGNALDGVLVRSGASPDLLENLIHDNKGVGVNLQDCAGRYERNDVYGNARGAVSVTAAFELDAGEIAGSNSLKGLFWKP